MGLAQAILSSSPVVSGPAASTESCCLRPRAAHLLQGPDFGCRREKTQTSKKIPRLTHRGQALRKTQVRPGFARLHQRGLADN